MLRFALLFFVVFLSACSTPKTLKLWNASTVANTPADVALLKGANADQQETGIAVADIQQMIWVKEKVEAVAGPMRSGFFLAEGDEPNGFSFSSTHGPVIAINIGMLKLINQDKDALAALIGHELAHLYLNHGKTRKEREEKRLATSVALSFAFGLVGAPMPFEATDAATAAVSSKFSREEENEADRVGLEYMIQAGFDPNGAIRLQQKLAASIKNESISFLSTHPASDERIERMKKLVQELRQKPGVARK